ncbi:hypothetical protein FRC03_000555 [Tulasnella sp. 419]|nr:hypothetical protein FRC03_000555 [Tulasnella sp. 419]
MPSKDFSIVINSLPDYNYHGVGSVPHSQGYGSMIPSPLGVECPRFSNHCSLRFSPTRSFKVNIYLIAHLCRTILRRDPDELILKEERWEKQPDKTYCKLVRFFDFAIMPGHPVSEWENTDCSPMFVEEQYPNTVRTIHPIVKKAKWRRYAIVDRKDTLFQLCKTLADRHDGLDHYFRDNASWITQQRQIWAPVWMREVSKAAYEACIQEEEYLHMIGNGRGDRYHVPLCEDHADEIDEVKGFIEAMGVVDNGRFPDAVDEAAMLKRQWKIYYEEQHGIPPERTPGVESFTFIESSVDNDFAGDKGAESVEMEV